MANTALQQAIISSKSLFVHQKKELTEILINFEVKNKYEVLDAQKNQLGFVVERGGGFWAVIKRWFFRSHRSFEIDVLERSGETLFQLKRAFFFFFSDLFVLDRSGQLLGSLHRRFGIIYKKYDLRDTTGQTFAKISSPIWRLWTFPIVNAASGQKQAEITKRWGGALREVFTDADTYMIDFGPTNWNPRQRAVIFAAAISIDFDFFENNQGRQGLFDFG